MFKTIVNSWKVPELRKKILFTLFIVIVFRVGSIIPVPFLDMVKLANNMKSEQAGLFSFLDTMSGGSLTQGTLLAMSVSPYITASIVMQLLTVAIPALERLTKEGEEGRKKMSAITRYVTVILGIIQGTGFYVYLRYQAHVVKYVNGFEGIFAAIVIVISFTAGTAFVMWLGEEINKKGIGNGISILLFAGIVARMPLMISKLYELVKTAANDPDVSGKYFIWVPAFVIFFLVIIWLIVFMNEAERRIPVQYAKRVIGRKLYGGQSSHIPIKVGLAGVMPIIFANSILSMPGMIAQLFFKKGDWFYDFYMNYLHQGTLAYSICYFLFIIGFAYFYVTIQYDPIEMANNLRQSNGTIPGIRPGKPTSDFLSKVLNRVTLIGALFLAFVAFAPLLFTLDEGMKTISLGGTSIIILVGVALETTKQMDSQMMMKHYKGFLD